MISWSVFICVAARLFILRTNDYLYDPAWTPLLGRLGVVRYQLRGYVHHRHENPTIGVHPCERILHGGQRH